MEFETRLLPPPPELLEHMREMDERDGLRHDLGWTGAMYIDYDGLPWWEFVDPTNMLMAIRFEDARQQHIVCHTEPMWYGPEGEDVHSFFIDRLEANIHQFMMEGPAFHEGE